MRSLRKCFWVRWLFVQFQSVQLWLHERISVTLAADWRNCKASLDSPTIRGYLFFPLDGATHSWCAGFRTDSVFRGSLLLDSDDSPCISQQLFLWLSSGWLVQSKCSTCYTVWPQSSHNIYTKRCNNWKTSDLSLL